MAALGRYDNNEFDESLKEFDNIADTSKILFNMGVIHATLGEHEKAVSKPGRRHTGWGEPKADELRRSSATNGQSG